MMLDVAGGVLIAASICALFAFGIWAGSEDNAGVAATCIIASIIAGIWVVLI